MLGTISRRRPMPLLPPPPLLPLMLARLATAPQGPPTVPEPRPGQVRMRDSPLDTSKETTGKLKSPRCDVEFPSTSFFFFSLTSLSSYKKKKKPNRLLRGRCLGRPRPALAALQAQGPQEENDDAGSRGDGSVAAAEAELRPEAAAAAVVPLRERRRKRRRRRRRGRRPRRRPGSRRQGRWRQGGVPCTGRCRRRQMAAGGSCRCGAGCRCGPGCGRGRGGREPAARRRGSGGSSSGRGRKGDCRCCCCCHCCCRCYYHDNDNEARFSAGSHGLRRQRGGRESERESGFIFFLFFLF